MARTSGNNDRWRRWRDWAVSRRKRYSFTIGATAALLFLLFLLFWAAFDISRAVQHKDEQLQVAGLRTQLVEFLLTTTREPDGSSLLDNPDDYAQARRPLKIATVRKPFFGYFLTKGNTKTFRKELVRTDQPRACTLEYPVDIEEAKQHSPNTVQACFATVQNDPLGRYVYAIIKYPTSEVVPHRRGRPLKDGDLIRLRFQSGGASPTTLRLVLEAPNLSTEAKRRNPANFEGLYEIAGFLNTETGQPTPLVSGQAIERAEHPEGVRYATVAIRIDATVFNQRFEGWPDAALKSMNIGIDIRRANATPIVISEAQKGAALASLAQAYLSSVPSGAILSFRKGSEAGPLFWSSETLETPRLEAAPGIMQWIGNWITDLLKGETIRVAQTIQSPTMGTLVAELRSSGNVIPDLAARVIAVLSFAALIVLYLAALVFYVARTVGQITADAMTLAKRRHSDVWDKYKRRRDQVSIVGRVISYLDRRIRAEVERKAKTLERAEAAIAQHQLSLSLIAHEIRSPVATLLLNDQLDVASRRLLERMQRAMDLLKEKREVDSTIDTVRPASHDLAASLSAYVSNLSSDEVRLAYTGPESGVLARYDDLLLDLVLAALFDNARRYVMPGTAIELRLTRHSRQDVIFEVFNQGSPVTDTEKIFKFGETSHDTASNLGIGLYAARQYVASFGGSIRAENRSNGFAIVVNLVPG